MKAEAENLRLQPDYPRYGYTAEVGKIGQAGDVGGHLLGRQFAGASEGVNLVPMDGAINIGPYLDVEKKWADALKQDPPLEVKVTIEPVYNPGNSSLRPDSFDISYSIDGRQSFISIPN